MCCVQREHAKYTFCGHKSWRSTMRWRERGRRNTLLRTRGDGESNCHGEWGAPCASVVEAAAAMGNGGVRQAWGAGWASGTC